MIHDVYQAIIFIVVIVLLAIILQRLMNPSKNKILRKYLELENEHKEQKSDPEKEKEFYEEIWLKKSKR